MCSTRVEELARRLGDPASEDGLLSRWLEAVFKRSWKLRTLVQEVGEVELSEPLVLLRERSRHFLETLAAALRGSERLEIGSPGYREAVQSLAFTAGWMAGRGLAVTDAVALIFGLREVLDWPEETFYQSLLMVVTEAFAASLVERERARYRDAMEKSQVVCDPHSRLPCLFLVGDPDRHALEDAVGRVMMLAVMREAGVVLVDGSALLAPDRALRVAAPILTEHSQAASVSVVLSGAGPALARELTSTGREMELFEDFRDAMARAMEICGIGWTERR
jgi:hypothetical protein